MSDSALENEIKNAPKPEEIEASSPVKAAKAVEEEVKKAQDTVEASVKAEPIVDKAAADKIAAEKKAAEKAQKEAARKQAKIDKKAKKAVAYQTKVEQCPRDYRPVSVGVYFWCGLLCWLPVVGIIFTLLFSLIPINKNFKNFARAILAAYVICLIVTLIFALIATLVMGQSVADLIWPFEQFFEEIIGAFGF